MIFYWYCAVLCKLAGRDPAVGSLTDSWRKRLGSLRLGRSALAASLLEESARPAPNLSKPFVKKYPVKKLKKGYLLIVFLFLKICILMKRLLPLFSISILEPFWFSERIWDERLGVGMGSPWRTAACGRLCGVSGNGWSGPDAWLQEVFVLLPLKYVCCTF